MIISAYKKRKENIIYNFKFNTYVKQKESTDNILYFGLKVCKKTDTKKVKIASLFYSYQVPFIHIKMEMKETCTERQCYKCA